MTRNFTPFPAFPHRGRSRSRSLSPLGETGKGVNVNKRKLIVYFCTFKTENTFFSSGLWFPRF